MFLKNCPLNLDGSCYVHPPILRLFQEKEFIESSADVISLEPQEIKLEYEFNSAEPAMTYFIIRNVHTIPLRVNVLAPETKFFQISYKETSWLFPGLTMKVQVTFFSKEARHYTDRIRINCLDRTREYNFVFQLNVSPASTAICEFPSIINWGVIPINKSVSYILTIKALEECDVMFLISVLNCDSDFTIAPKQGVVTKHDKKVHVRVTYTPTRYVISTFHVHVHIPIISETPFLIKFKAECKPDCPQMRLNERLERKKIIAVSDPEKEVFFNTDIFSSNLDLVLYYMDGVNKLLIENTTKNPDSNDLRGPLNFYLDEDYEAFKQHLQFCFWKAICVRRCNDIQIIQHKAVHGLFSHEINNPQKREEIDIIRNIMNSVYESRLKDNAPEYINNSSVNGVNIRKRLTRNFKTMYTFVPTNKIEDSWYYRMKAIDR